MKFVKLKFDFFCSNTSHVFQILRQQVAQVRPKYSDFIFLNGLCLVSVC